MALPTDFIFNNDLKEVPLDPLGLKQYVENLKISIENKSIDQKISALGEIGVWLRILNELDQAEKYINESLQLLLNSDLEEKESLLIQQKIRLAHVYQYKKKFDLSNEFFTNILDEIRRNKSLHYYLPFALQHAGKNLFDQSLFQESLSLFEEALRIRIHTNAPDEQIQSSKFAIKITSNKILAS